MLFLEREISHLSEIAAPYFILLDLLPAIAAQAVFMLQDQNKHTGRISRANG
jgi:hypothetical protein